MQALGCGTRLFDYLTFKDNIEICVEGDYMYHLNLSSAMLFLLNYCRSSLEEMPESTTISGKSD
jgi:hypothetical protein